MVTLSITCPLYNTAADPNSYLHFPANHTRSEVIRTRVGTKIVATRKCAVPTFSLVNFPCYVSRTFLIINPRNINLHSLLALLNSKLIAFWLFHKGKLQGNQFQIDIVPLTRLPLCNREGKSSNEIVRAVDGLLAAYNKKSSVNNKELERSIDALVYELYDLTAKEIAIVEKSATANW